jgi:enoyl-CoA hydratase
MQYVQYEVRDSIALVTLNRPESNNAQNAELLKELDDCFRGASNDNDVRVIVLKANGKHFSAGHDIAPNVMKEEPWCSMFDDVDRTGLLKMYDWETKHYFGYARAWRDIPKPTIAVVQGACVAAGLMLAWPMDIILAADNARFSDPVALMGIGGVEYQAHAWELGARKAKEMLFTGGWVSVEEAHRLGMVNQIVTLDTLEESALKIASRIAAMPPHAMRMAKRSINATLDAQGQHTALNYGFETHSLGHANAWVTHGQATTAGLEEMSTKNKEKQ